MTQTPTTEAELLNRAQALCGLTLGRLALGLGWKVPTSLRRAKGWVGRLIEAHLGAGGSTRAGPDLPHLGIEIKSVPIDRRGRPRESTWVCQAPLDHQILAPWDTSPARAKLNRVLWVPVQADPAVPVVHRRVGTSLLWSPSPTEEAILRQDWTDLSSLIGEGWAMSASAHRGRALQLRPKAANASVTAWGIDDAGDPIRVRPLGFYLRRPFVEGILATHFQMAGG